MTISFRLTDSTSSGSGALGTIDGYKEELDCCVPSLELGQILTAA